MLPGEISGRPFDIQDNTGCEILLLDHADQIQVDALKDCKVRHP